VDDSPIFFSTHTCLPRKAYTMLHDAKKREKRLIESLRLAHGL
jgi:hypothetical protein